MPLGFCRLSGDCRRPEKLTSAPSCALQIASVHFQQPEAVAAIRKLDRIVELSHWGNNLAIQDTIDLFNAGPE